MRDAVVLIVIRDGSGSDMAKAKIAYVCGECGAEYS